MQVLISAARFAAALLTNSGSARKGRAIETMSAPPSVSSDSASSGVLMRLVVTSGRSTSRLSLAVTQAKAARGTRAELLALRGVALDRLGRGTEALAACDEACQEQPLEALGAEKAVSLLYTLSLVYTAAGQHGKVTALTAGLAAAAPKDPDLQERLFKCHCREFDFVRMQQVAMRLYKLTGNSSYLMWAVTTMLLQATHGGEEKLLVLAETMAGRCWAQKRAAGLELGREHQ